MEPDKDIY